MSRAFDRRLWLLVLLAGAAAAQQPPLPETAPASPPPARPSDPYRAYAAGQYDRALESFVDRQVERPDDPAVALNIGSAHYQMKDYEAARRAFGSAALAADPGLRAQALYNLGNTAYREGKLEEAIQFYQATLDVTPDDEDAKFNLEFVRDEIRRRHEEAKKRQEQQQGGQQPQPGGEQQQNDEDGEGDQQGETQPPSGGGEPDRDQDGLPDELERSAANPTDPDDPDSDDDGLADGDEDRNRNGQVDDGETDPNRADSDGDGVDDGEEAAAEATAAGDEPEVGEMTPGEAARYLQALEEGRPQPPTRPARRGRVEKDW